MRNTASYVRMYIHVYYSMYVYVFIRNTDGGPASDVFLTRNVNGRKYIVCVVESAAMLKLLECQIEDDMNLVSIARESHGISGVMAVPVEVRGRCKPPCSFPIPCGPNPCIILCTYVCTSMYNKNELRQTKR